MDRAKLVAQLIIDEGNVLHEYQDELGNWTNGVGHLLPNGPTGIVLTPEQSLAQLDSDIDEKVAELTADLPWLATLDDVRQNVLINMAFNLGVSGLLKFHNTLAFVHAGRYIEAAGAMLQSKWATEVGARATELAEEMKTGQFNS